MSECYCPYCMSKTDGDAPCPKCGLTEGAYQPKPHHLPPGSILLGRYLIGRVLGEGGFGITYIGFDLRLELKVAVKEYFPSNWVTRSAEQSLAVTRYTGASGSYEHGLERFLREARTMAKVVKQREIVSVRDFFEANDTAYIVMEYVDGTTFKELVAQRGGRIEPKELFSLVEPLFPALAAVHAAGLIHRDISPDNLMLEGSCVRLLDFGCAREATLGSETMTITLKHGFAPIEQYQHKGQGLPLLSPQQLLGPAQQAAEPGCLRRVFLWRGGSPCRPDHLFFMHCAHPFLAPDIRGGLRSQNTP